LLDTEQERRLDEALNYLKIPHETGEVLCFRCGKHWKNFHEGKPKSCMKCGGEYYEAGQWCQPDNIIKNGDKEAVVFVDGGIHGKKH